MSTLLAQMYESAGQGSLQTSFDANHRHNVYYTTDGTGETSVTANHKHTVTNGKVSTDPDGHTHTVMGLPS